MKPTFWILRVILFLSFISSARGLPPETPPPQVPEPQTADIEAALKQVQEDASLEEALKASLVELYQRALDQIKLAESHRAKAQRFDELARSVPARMQQIREKLATPPPEPVPDPPPDASLGQLDQLLAREEEALRAAEKNLSEILSEQEERIKRRAAAPKLLSTAKEKLVEVTAQLATPPPPDEPESLTAARRTLLRSQKKSLEEEIDSYEKEIASYDARTELIALRRSEGERDRAEAEKRLKAWRDLVTTRRQMETEAAERRAREAREAASLAKPAARRILEENARMAAERRALSEKIPATERATDGIRALLDRTRTTYRSLVRKVDAMGLTATVGVLLRTQRARMPSIREHEANLEAREQELAQVEVWLVDLEEKRRLTNQKLVDELLEETDTPQEDREDEEYTERLTELVSQSRNEYVIPLAADFESYSNKLADLDGFERELVTLLETMSEFIDERILWTRSAYTLKAEDMARAWEALHWLTDPEEWARLGRTAADRISEDPLPLSACALFFLLLVLVRYALLRRLLWLGDAASRAGTTPFGITMQAFVVTMALSLLAPTGLVAMAGLVRWLGSRNELATALVRGLLISAAILLTVEILRRACRKNGLGERHFVWSPHVLRVLRKNTRFLAILLIPAVFLTGAMEGQGTESYKTSLGRLAFIVALAVFAVFTHGVLSPRTGIYRNQVRARRGSLLARGLLLGYLVAVAAPLVLVVIVWLGYYYTGLKLAWSLKVTLWLVLSLVLLRALLLRWLLLARQRVAVEQAQARREAEQAQTTRESPGEPAQAMQQAPPAFAPPTVDLTAIRTRTTKLVRLIVTVTFILGLWLIWIDVFPALGILDQVDLGWSKAVTVSEQVLKKDALGEDVIVEQLVSRDVPVTLTDLMLAVVAAVLTIGAARNLPGFLQITLLQRLPLDAGARYAITAVSGYVISLVGIVVAFTIIGVGWSKVQWLAAALTVGLGFGLQEIFANFVSGMIIFFERPIRIGDVVTIDTVTGTVSRIRIRATTITDWDRKEYVVPNKDFITGRLLNWTLSDATNRVVIPVGVAYGSDTDLARRILVEVADENPNVLKDPPPFATFEQFADSTLNLSLRCYLPGLESRLLVITELHTAIDRKFREAGIEIAFPQRDLHLRSSDGTVQVKSAGEQPSQGA